MSIKKTSDIIKTVYDLAKPLAEKLNLDLWDIRFEKEGADWYLRVFIDKDQGVTIDDCEALSRPLNNILDETDPIDRSYIFEVSSPGLGRQLKKPEHFEKFIGEEIRLKLYKVVNGQKEITGILKEYNKDFIVLEIAGEISQIKNNEYAIARLNDDKDLFN